MQRAPDVNFVDLGYFRAAAVSPAIELANPAANADVHIAELRALAAENVSLVVFPELSLTGFSIDDLFHDTTLLHTTRTALARVAAATANLPLATVVGAPLRATDGRLFNCALLCAQGRVIGAVPKVHLPGYAEFYDHRWFTSGRDIELHISAPEFDTFVLAQRQIFSIDSVAVGIEVCEDLWAAQSPGSELALAGAEVIVNPSASNELVAKADYRADLVRMASAQRLCAYLYTSAGVFESTRDVVFGGHMLAAECGVNLASSERFSLHNERQIVDFDIERIRHDRAFNTTFAKTPRDRIFKRTDVDCERVLPRLRREYRRNPFVPDDETEVSARAAEILAIQSAGLARRVLAARSPNMVIALSGGLDSTLAFLVCLLTAQRLERDPNCIVAVTMPGPGTSAQTLASARDLAAATGVTLLEIPIHSAVAQHLADLDHLQHHHDVVFENAQARERTQVVFNLANKHQGIVVGTGDLSELALGWCTFNADQMANYNVNASVPKTLISYLVRWYGQHQADATLADVLRRVLATPISPELIPAADDGIAQRTEEIVGPYELHDFFLYHFLRHGSRPTKIFALARRAFDDIEAATIKRWLGVFFGRFFAQQFKRTTLPPGPKVGSVSLSPRGDWRMPDEVAATIWLNEIEALDAAGSQGSND